MMRREERRREKRDVMSSGGRWGGTGDGDSDFLQV